jgi:tetratricopeptide (TPR) repeat protein
MAYTAIFGNRRNVKICTIAPGLPEGQIHRASMASVLSKKYALIAAAAALIVGVLHALPYAGTAVSLRAQHAAARGIASLQNVPGYEAASWLDAAAARLWRAGGAAALAWGEFFSVFLWWTLASAVVLVAVAFGLRWVKTKPGLIFAAAIVLLLAFAAPAAWRSLTRWGDGLREPRLITAVELADAVKTMPREALFSNPSTFPPLLLFSPNSAGGLTPQLSAALSINPPAWRKALRSSAWRAVALSGPVGEFRPLLEHLLTSPDWRLALVTNHGYLFLRESGPAAAPINPASFRLGGDRETAIYLAQIAERYDAVRQPAAALECLNRALELAPEEVSVLSHAATFAAGRKRWQDALTYSSRALAREPDNAHAKLVRALALLETGQAQQAQNLAGEVLAQAPDDLYTLFLYARICRTLHDYAQEAATLERLTALSEKSSLSTVNYRIFLGQAYARQGLPEPALKNYRLVLESGTLNPEQAQEIRDAISAIEENAPKE